MNTVQWIQLLSEQARVYGKSVFTTTELCNLSGQSRKTLAVTVSRLVTREVLMRLGHGLYGISIPQPAELLKHLDPAAYCTGHWILYNKGIITQTPAMVTCFTNRQHFRNPACKTPVATFEFVVPSKRIYHPPPDAQIVSLEQALCDFIFVCLHRGVKPRSLATLRHLERVDRAVLDGMLQRYPATVCRELGRILESTGNAAECDNGKGLK